MLLDPSTDALKTCNFKYIPHGHNQWDYLRTDGSWLFSLMDLITLRVICSGETLALHLNGTGLLKLGPQCSGKADGLSLPSLDRYNRSTTYFYQPTLNLSILQLFPKLENHVNRLDRLNPDSSRGVESNWKPQDGKSMEQILSELEEINNRQADQNLSHGLSLGSTLISILITIIVCLGLYIRVHHLGKKMEVTPGVTLSTVAPNLPEHKNT